jgi:hypothetical protein
LNSPLVWHFERTLQLRAHVEPRCFPFRPRYVPWASRRVLKVPAAIRVFRSGVLHCCIKARKSFELKPRILRSEDARNGGAWFSR